MTVQAAAVTASDLTARARIREAALRLFGRAGFSVSIRAIAEEAGVSSALVIHHFGSKDGLRRAVDDAVIEAFERRYAELPTGLSPAELSRVGGAAFGEVVGANPDIRDYLRRSLLEGTPASAAIFDRLLEWVRDGITLLEGAGALRADADPVWRPFQMLFVMLGASLLQPVIQRHFDEPMFDPDVLRARSASNYDFVARGLLAQP